MTSFETIFSSSLSPNLESHSLFTVLAQWVKNLPEMKETQETLVLPLGWEYPHGGGNDISLQYSCLKNPIEELGGLRTKMSQRVRYN